MPRSGGIYSVPTASRNDAQSGTTVSSAPYLALLDDLTADLNAARPITAGGTGATTAAQARANLGITSMPDPDYDGLLGWDDSAGATIYYTLGAGLEFNGTEVRSTATAFALTLLDDADAATARGTLGLGTAATLTAGTGANNAVQLDGSARLPAVDASQLTNLPVAQISGSANDVSGSRAHSTSYQNTRGKPIWVAVAAENSSGAQPMNLQISPDNSTWYSVAGLDSANNAVSYAMSSHVPNNWYYRLFVGTGTITINSWMEIY